MLRFLILNFGNSFLAKVKYLNENRKLTHFRAFQCFMLRKFMS